MAKIDPDIIIVGAGWAGLSCAIKLAQHNRKVTLIESAPFVGGRARSVTVNNTMVDNGQHLLIGAYSKTQELLQSININPQQVFLRLPMSLILMNDNNFNFNLKLPKLPKPWNLLVGLLRAKGISIKEKYKLAQCFSKIADNNFKLEHDCSILATLQQYQQSNNLIYNFWEPIAKAAMSTSIDMASANIFFKVIQDSFFSDNGNSDWLLPKVHLSNLFANPAINYLKKNNVKIICNNRAKSIIIDNDKCIKINTNKGVFSGEKIILATPPNTSSGLLSTITTPIESETTEFIKKLAKITFEPITTIYFYFSTTISIPYPMIGLTNGPGQWLFNRNFCNHDITEPTNNSINILSVIITGKSSYNDRAQLINATFSQIKSIFPNTPDFNYVKVICEKKAAFSCTPEVNKLRPTNNTPIDNILLAGDYTQTAYPATLEGAVRSGFSCANSILTS